MKRFNFEEDDDEDDDEEYYEESEEMPMDMDFEDHLLAMTHFPMENDNLLPSAIQICEKSLFNTKFLIRKNRNLKRLKKK